MDEHAPLDLAMTPAPKPETETETAIAEIAEALGEFFADEPWKITHWLLTPNPMLGYIAPASLILVGRAHKVAEFIRDAQEGSIA